MLQQRNVEKAFAPVINVTLSWLFYINLAADHIVLKGLSRFNILPEEIGSHGIKEFEIVYAPTKNAWVSLCFFSRDKKDITIISSRDKSAASGVFEGPDENKTRMLRPLGAPRDGLNTMRISFKHPGYADISLNGVNTRTKIPGRRFNKIILGTGQRTNRIYKLRLTGEDGAKILFNTGYFSGRSGSAGLIIYLLFAAFAIFLTLRQYNSRFFLNENGWSRLITWKCLFLAFILLENSVTAAFILFLLAIVMWDAIKALLKRFFNRRRIMKLAIAKEKCNRLARLLIYTGIAILLIGCMMPFGVRLLGGNALKQPWSENHPANVIPFGKTKTLYMHVSPGHSDRVDFDVRFSSRGWAEIGLKNRHGDPPFGFGKDTLILSATDEFPTHGNYFLLESISLLLNYSKNPYCRTCTPTSLIPGKKYHITLTAHGNTMSVYVNGVMAERFSLTQPDSPLMSILCPTGNMWISAPIHSPFKPRFAWDRVSYWVWNIAFLCLMLAAALLAAAKFGEMFFGVQDLLLTLPLFLWAAAVFIVVAKGISYNDRDIVAAVFFIIALSITTALLLMLIPETPGVRRRWFLVTVLFFVSALELSRLGFNMSSHYIGAQWYHGLKTETAMMWFNPSLRIYHNSYMQDERLRGRKVATDKGDKIRILLIGGSQTYGQYIADWNETAAGQIQKSLDKDRRNVEVLNGGYGAATSFSQLLFFKVALHNYHPDIVVLNIGANDSLLWRGDIGYFDRLVRRGESVFHRLTAMSITAMLGQKVFSSGFFKSFHLIGKRDKFFWDNVHEFGRMQKPMGYRLFLVKEVSADICYKNVSRMNPFMDGAENGKEFPQLKADNITPIFPGPAFCKHQGEPLFIDGIHLAPKGNELLGKLIFEKITPALDMLQKGKRQ